MALSPMMQEYLQRKEEYKDCILLYRVGDFYEMFFDDAVTVSREIELTLTGKECGLPERAPMCGVPFHALDTYVKKLIDAGHKVAICDQVEDPKEAKGLVKREVTRVVTPGTSFENAEGMEGRNNFLMSIVYTDGVFGISACDVTTGEFIVTETDSLKTAIDDIDRFQPSEIICNESSFISGLPLRELRESDGVMVGSVDDSSLGDESALDIVLSHFKAGSAAALGIEHMSSAVSSAGALLKYLYDTQKTDLRHISSLTIYNTGSYMVLSSSTIRNLELVETMRDKDKKGSLLSVLDRTRTAMGARFLRTAVEQPLIDRALITERLDAVSELFENEITHAELREYLSPIYDLERLVARISYRTANPRDLIALKTSFSYLPAIKGLMKEFSCSKLKTLMDDLDDLADLHELIDAAIDEDPPQGVREGGIIRSGYSAQVDEYREAGSQGKQWLADLESREKEATGISTLKVKFNRVFGYCIEVSNSFKDKVPGHYTRRQTLVGGERYTTSELKELEDKILGARDKLFTLEYDLFCGVRDRLSEQLVRILGTARVIAELDMLSSLAYVAGKNHYVRPEIATDGEIIIKGGRHPVVEKITKEERFVPNDVHLDSKSRRVAVITGPNMAGKSTYMRQTALIALMAQMGSFVPADSAKISICDQIFTRVGASDDLSRGQSTFMVEMTEVSGILRNATSDSLLILDEIGRGTSTFDGLSLAWAIIEYIADKRIIGAKTLFATHYHELTELEGKIDGVKNYNIAVKEKADGIIFLRKIIRGGADKSYGIQVARLAGVPEAVLARAAELTEKLALSDITSTVESLAGSTVKKAKPVHYDDVDLSQISFFDTVKDDDVISELRDMKLESLTPLDALNELYRLQNMLNNRWKNE